VVLLQGGLEGLDQSLLLSLVEWLEWYHRQASNEWGGES
jgi:hypothetical protein